MMEAKLYVGFSKDQKLPTKAWNEKGGFGGQFEMIGDHELPWDFFGVGQG